MAVFAAGMIPLSADNVWLLFDAGAVRLGGFSCAGFRRRLLLFHIAFRTMKNSHRIEPDRPLFSDGKAYALAAADDSTRRSAAARIALQLENAMVREGWPEGEPIGSEQALAERLGTSRETMREAVRILVHRGSMRMVRGRFGGLAPSHPGPEPAAASIALYLRACGCTAAQIGAAIRLIDPILARFAAEAKDRGRLAEGTSLRRWLAATAGSRGLDLYAALADLLTAPVAAAEAERLAAAVAAGDGEEAAALADLPTGPLAAPAEALAGSELRSMRIAARLLDRILSTDLACGGRLGSEWELGCEFDTCRATIRQALAMLEDLELIEPRRGRGGGYVVKRPSPAGAIRHAYLFLVLGPPDALPPMRLLDALNLVHLKLAAARLEPLPRAERRARLQDFVRFAFEGDPDMRLLKVLEELGRLADNPLVDTLLRCFVATQARASVTDPHLPPPVQAAILAHHEAVAEALETGDAADAERHFRAVQQALQALCAGRPPAPPAR